MKFKKNRIHTTNPFSIREQMLCLAPIVALREKFKRATWGQIKEENPRLASLPGIRNRLGK